MDRALFDKINLPVVDRAPLSDYTTFRLGGACAALIHCRTPSELQQAVDSCHRQKWKFILIGGGSNLVVSDRGVDCIVICYASEKPLIERVETVMDVSGSTMLDDLAGYAAENGLEGLNCTTGIPGTVRGAIVGNAGAFGKQIGDVVRSVTVIRTERSRPFPAKLVLSSKELNFSYRHSALKSSGDIVVSAQLGLSLGDREVLLREREEILAVRRDKHPDLSTHPCAGSFFRNVEPSSKSGRRQATGWFLDQAGGKHLHSGGARIFEKHANIIVKGNHCKAQDVYELSKKMAVLAKERYDLNLVREVRFVGKFMGMPEDVCEVIW